MSAFQRPAVNWLVVTIQWPSGLKLPGVDGEEVADEDAQQTAGAGAPDASRVVGADRDELEAVRRVLRVVDELGVAPQRVEELSGRGVPELGDLALRRRHAETARREDGVLGRDVDRAHELARRRCRRGRSPAAGRGSARRRSRAPRPARRRGRRSQTRAGAVRRPRRRAVRRARSAASRRARTRAR